MDFLAPRSWADALAAKAEHPEAVPIAGGTDVMVELNFNRLRPPALLDLSKVGELRDWGQDNGVLRVGCRRHLRPGHQRAGPPAPGASHGLADGRLSSDPQPGHGGGQPGLGLARRRRPSAPAGQRSFGRGGVCPGAAGGTGGGLLQGAEAARPPAG